MSRRGRWPALHLIGIALAVTVFLFSWVFLGQSFYGRYAKTDTQSNDTVVYQGYAQAVGDGKVPYRDFSLVYPPGALPVLLGPEAVARSGDLGSYRRWFARLMAACGVLCVLLVIAARASPFAVAFVAVSPLLVGSLLLQRFDLWPAALLAASVAAFVRDRHSLGWAALGAAVSAKLFPVVLVPLAIVWTLRRAGAGALRRGLLVCGALVAASFVPFAVLAPHGLWESVRGQVWRAIQVESLIGTMLMVLGHRANKDSLGAAGIAGHGTLAAVSTMVEVAVLIALWVGFARGEMEPNRLTRFFAASVCAFIVLGKVLSPQFLIWLIPLVPLVRGRRGLVATGLLTAAVTTTQWYYPARYGDVINLHLAWVVLARNLMLVVLIAVLALPSGWASKTAGGLLRRHPAEE